MPKESFSGQKRSLLDLFERHRLVSDQKLLSREKLSSFKCTDFALSTNKNLGSISVIRELGDPREPWSQVPAPVPRFAPPGSPSLENPLPFPRLFDSTLCLQKESPQSRKCPPAERDSISKLLSLKVRESRPKARPGCGGASMPTQPHLCGDCRPGCGSQPKQGGSEAQASGGAAKKCGNGAAKCGEIPCKWNGKAFDPEKDEIHMMRLKSSDHRPDVFIACCCPNKEFLARVVLKIGQFQQAQGAGPGGKPAGTATPRNSQVAGPPLFQASGGEAGARADASIEIPDEMALMTKVQNVGNRIIEKLRLPLPSARSPGQSLNVASSLRNLAEAEGASPAGQTGAGKDTLSLLSKKLQAKASRNSGEILFKSGLELANLASKLSSRLGSFAQKSRNALESPGAGLGKRSPPGGGAPRALKRVKRAAGPRNVDLRLPVFESVENTGLGAGKGLCVDEKPRRRAAKAKKKAGSCCKCAKSMCLKLYCQCFASGRECVDECACESCHNRQEFKELKELVIMDTKEKNPEAFNSKYRQRGRGKHEIVHSRGCNCKTGCNKKYCECLKAGTGCSGLCKCTGCENHKIVIGQEEVPRLYVKVLRKRKRRNILGEYIKLRGQMAYADFIAKMRDMVANQKKRRRKTPPPPRPPLRLPGAGESENVHEGNRRPGLRRAKAKQKGLEEAKDSVFIESAVLSETKFS